MFIRESSVFKDVAAVRLMTIYMMLKVYSYSSYFPTPGSRLLCYSKFLCYHNYHSDVIKKCLVYQNVDALSCDNLNIDRSDWYLLYFCRDKVVCTTQDNEVMLVYDLSNVYEDGYHFDTAVPNVSYVNNHNFSFLKVLEKVINLYITEDFVSYTVFRKTYAAAA